MSCPNDATLWSYAEGALDAAERAAIADHLSGCPACQQSLRTVQTTRSVLQTAGGLSPQVDWRRADERVMGAATARIARSVRWRAPAWGLGGALIAAGIALAIWAPWRAHPTATGSGMLAGVVIESAGEGSTVRSAAHEVVAVREGGGIPGGATLSTTSSGPTVVRLPEQSRARLAPKSSASILRATRDEIALRLESGAVTVKAAHVARKEFLVDADAAQIRVVGTAFRVQREPDRVIVTVAEGRVLVEPKDGPGRLIDAGHAAVITSEGAWSSPPHDAAFADTTDFDALGVEVARADPRPATRTESHATPSVTPRETPRGTKQQDATDAVAALSTPEIPRTPALAPVSPPEAAVETPPVPAEPVMDSPSIPPTTAEGLFLSRAQAALKTGRCRNYQLGLQDVVEGSEDQKAREIAQILRARCFDEQLEPAAALREYRKYLKLFPAGRFAPEAHSAIGD